MKRAWVLLEVMLALSIFTMAALVVLSVMGQAARNVELTREELTGLDLARSAIARLEAGLKSAEELRGPVPLWSQYETKPGAAAFEDDLPEPSGWELEIQTEPSAFAGLTLVEVTAQRRDEATGLTGYSTTLRQLVRLSARAEDTIGADDALTAEAARGARRGGTSGARSSGGGPVP